MPETSVYVEGGQHTNLIQLQDLEFGAHLAQERFGGFAVGAPGFAEDGYDITASAIRPLFLGALLGRRWGGGHTNGILVNNLLRFGFCGRHGGGGDA